MRPYRFILFFLALLLAGCATRTPIPRTLEDVSSFLDQARPLPETLQKRLYADLLDHRYRVWQPSPSPFDRQKAEWAARFYPAKTTYAENRRRIPAETYRDWIDNARYDALGSLNRPGITLYPTDLRLFPTRKPIFYDPDKPGEGYPFDYNQNSAVKAMTPLLVSHLSRDGAWAFVRTPFAEGWIGVRDIVLLDDDAVASLIGRPLVTLLPPRTPLYDPSGRFLYYAKNATLLPLLHQQPEGFVVSLATVKGWQKARIPLSKAQAMPLPMNRQNIKRVARSLLNEPYGWGGLVSDRDCSAMTRDFFMPFGIWLPRNSKAQAKIGRVIDLSKLSPKQKERHIIKEGVPFQTLLYLPGHIMLYIGHKDGRAYAMHNTWGIRTKGGGRYIIGRAVISDLYLGDNLPEADKKALLIHRIQSMNIVTENVLQ